MRPFYDVAVVGYGPVGATAAALLADSGLAIALIEPNTALFDKPRAVGADDEFLRVMQWCGIGEELGRHIVPYNGTVYLGVDGQPIRAFEPARPPYRLGWPPVHFFIQPEVDQMLRAAVGRHANVEPLLGRRVIDVAQSADEVCLTVEQVDTRQQRPLRARYVLACDGANSAVRKRLGIALEDLKFDETWAVVDAWMQSLQGVGDHNVQYCWPSRPATYVIAPRNMRRWELKVLPGEDPRAIDEPRLLEMLAPYVDVSTLKIWRSAVYRFHALVARRWRAGRIFLLGDAAHQTPPFLGQGLTSGVRDAANLAWKLRLVDRGQAPDSLLDSYEAERLPHMRTMIELTKQMGLIIGELDQEAAQRRDERLREERRSGRLETNRVRLVPTLRPPAFIHAPNDGPNAGAGSVFPQPTVRDAAGRVALLEEHLPRHFLLVSDRIDALRSLDERTLQRWRSLAGELVVLSPDAPTDWVGMPFCRVLHDFQHHYQDWARAQRAFATVVRPDRYVYGVADRPDALQTLLEELQTRLQTARDPL